jgi:hypothetical protein
MRLSAGLGNLERRSTGRSRSVGINCFQAGDHGSQFDNTSPRFVAWTDGFIDVPLRFPSLVKGRIEFFNTTYPTGPHQAEHEAAPLKQR